MYGVVVTRYLALFIHLLVFTTFFQYFRIMVEMFFAVEKNRDGGDPSSELGTTQLGW